MAYRFISLCFFFFLQQLLLKSIPSCFELKCRAYSLLSQCYHLVGAIPPQKQVLHKGLELTASVGYEYALYFLDLTLEISALKVELETTKRTYEVQFSQMEEEANNFKATLTRKVQEYEHQLDRVLVSDEWLSRLNKWNHRSI